MTRTISTPGWLSCVLLLAGAGGVHAQKGPYDVFPAAEPPYYRVRYEASTNKGELPYSVNYTIWIPKGVKTLRGVIVHQHGCGEGSCKSGLTGAYDLHWQALAKKHDCALLSPSYEQPDKADCQMWCDPRNGSDAAFQKCLVDLGAKSGHPELAKVPWALWGHSGGGHWAGGMVMLHPERIAAAWLRSGVPLLKADPNRKGIKAHTLPEAALKVPLMCNLGTREGVTEKGKQFAGVWPANETFFNEVRGKGGLVGVAIDPLSSHDCGNQRYLAIPWLDACLGARLPKSGDALRPMPTDNAWLAPVLGAEAVQAAKHSGDPLKPAWLPNEAIAKSWMEYVKDTKVTDTTPPPAPTNLRLSVLRLQGNKLTWEAEADLESGLAHFIIERDGQVIATVPEKAKNPFGRPVFQNLQYSDTPTQPLVPMQFSDLSAMPDKKYAYRVITVNTVGLKSKPSVEAVAALDRPGPAGSLTVYEDKKKPGEWVSLFNGKNLDGWTPKFAGHEAGENYLDTFRAENGVIKVSYDKYKQFDSKFGHLFYKDKFSHYDLRLEYRFLGDQVKAGPSWATRNSGVMFHCQSPQSMRKEQDFPVSIEFQFLGGLGKGERPTGNMCSPGTNIVMGNKLITQHCVNSKSKTFPGDQWVTAEIQVRGAGKIKHLINGEVVMEYEQPQLDPKDKDGAALIKAANGKLLLEEGYIALQAESHPCEFRKIEVRVVK